MSRVSNADLAKLLRSIEKTPGYTVIYRNHRALVTGPHGSAFIKVGSSGYDRMAVLRLLHKTGWGFASDPLQLPPPPDIPAVEEHHEVPQHQENHEMSIPAQGATPNTERYLEAVAAFLEARQGQTYTADQIVDQVDIPNYHSKRNTRIVLISTGWLNATNHVNPQMLHVHRKPNRPLRYYWSETKRDSMAVMRAELGHRQARQAAAHGAPPPPPPQQTLPVDPPPAPPAPPARPAPVKPVAEVFEELARLADGSLLLQDAEGSLYTATLLRKA